METIFEYVTDYFTNIWTMFDSIVVPGFDVSVARVCLGFFVINWSLNILAVVTGFRTNAASASESMRSSRETLTQYRKVKEQNDNRSKLSGGIGFHP